jgi:hypothetical protein
LVLTEAGEHLPLYSQHGDRLLEHHLCDQSTEGEDLFALTDDNGSRRMAVEDQFEQYAASGA